MYPMHKDSVCSCRIMKLTGRGLQDGHSEGETCFNSLRVSKNGIASIHSNLLILLPSVALHMDKVQIFFVSGNCKCLESMASYQVSH